MALVDLGRTRPDPLSRERANEVAELPLLVGQDVPGHAVTLVRRVRIDRRMRMSEGKSTSGLLSDE